MVQKYKRKTQRHGWDEDKMRQAIEGVRNGLPYKTAARNFCIPLMSLKRRCKGKNKLALNWKLGSRTQLFTEEQEQELVSHILDMESRMSPEATSAARARAPVVIKFCMLLSTVLDKTPFSPFRIFNVDETSISTVPGRNCKTMAKRGRKQVGRVVSTERGVSTTAVIYEPENWPQNDEDNDQINIRGAPSIPPEQIIRHEQLTDSSNAFKELSYQENLATSSISFNDINQHDNANVIPSTSAVSNVFKILPKMSQKQRTTRSRKSGDTVILTSTSYKDQLVDERQEQTAEQEENKALKLKTKEAGNQKVKSKKPITKGKNSKRRKEDEDDEESEVEEDPECLICSETFLICPAGEGWVQCINYHRWAHDECAGIEDNDCVPYYCDYCIENVRRNKVRRKRLS
ncbi:hypothetical protein NQ314_001099 [Rhamnusium bicolor]|uniref:Zinc finger PHD-type domain-containing protein n=1 Tax=Rhamnusium bicolor TaxID=1586634 RepID=A0AAV8ZV61_9CUCU|nr:hypothetical protein NQ314_001099 [Rhamnusium bicolor]